MNNHIKSLGKLQLIRGLGKPMLLTTTMRKRVRELDAPENTGVIAVLRRQHVFVVTHDASFRKPQEPITKQTTRGIVFPAIPFPEIKGAISASPGNTVHRYLITLLRKRAIRVKKDDATLLIGV